MPNQRGKGIINVSFTMPKALADAVEQKARKEFTNRSDLVRRAVLSYLGPEEAEEIRRSVMNEDEGTREMPPQKPVSYTAPKKKPKGN